MSFPAWNAYSTQLKVACAAAGARDTLRVAASVSKAVQAGEALADVLASLKRWQPELFRGRR
jgi:hypothetical protein